MVGRKDGNDMWVGRIKSLKCFSRTLFSFKVGPD